MDENSSGQLATGDSKIAKSFGVALFAMLFALRVSAEAQQQKALSRIGYLSAIDKNTESKRIDAIRHALSEIGYIEGQSILAEYRYADGNLNRVPELAEELVRLKVDVIVTTGAILLSARPRTRPGSFPLSWWVAARNRWLRALSKASLARAVT